MSLKRSALSKTLGSVAVIALVATLSVGATVAYFSGTEDQGTTVSTATIDLDATSGFPLNFNLLLPGETQYVDASVQNVGDRPADFYVQLLSTGGGTNFCTPNDVLDVRIDNLSDGGTWYNNSICYLFPGWSGSVIVKVADDVAAGATKTFRIYLTLDATAGNTYEGASNTDTVHLIAVQYNGPPPMPDTDGGLTQYPWPTENGTDQDVNYPGL